VLRGRAATSADDVDQPLLGKINGASLC
jgi:hypothetical protein